MRKVKEISFENKDIIIVDPCYFTDSDDDRESSKSGRDLSRLHINGIGTPTVWGDIAAYVVSTDGHVLGTVTADSGIICVADLDDVCNYNEQFNYYRYHCTIIDNFTGTVRIEYDRNERFYSMTGTGTYNEANDKITFKFPIDF